MKETTMNIEMNKSQAVTPLQIVDRLRTLATPLDQVGKLMRWQQAFDKATQTDGKNPTMADIMDLVLLSIEDVSDRTARVSRAEVNIEGKTVAGFSFPIIQMALLAKIALTWGPNGPDGREDVSAEDIMARMLQVFRRYHQDCVFTMTVEEYEAKLTDASMFSEKAKELSRLIVSTLAGARGDGLIEATKPLDQLMTAGDTPSC